MIQLIQSFFESIGEFFSKIWDFIVMIWEELTQFFKILGPTIKFFQHMLTFLPGIYLGFGIALLVVLLLYIIIGRTAGGD